jgi:hypothetical protein
MFWTVVALMVVNLSSEISYLSNYPLGLLTFPIKKWSAAAALNLNMMCVITSSATRLVSLAISKSTFLANAS